MTAAGRAGHSLLCAVALIIQGLYLPCQPMTVLLAVLFLSLREEPAAAGCRGWLLGLLWGLMAGLPVVPLGALLAAAAAMTAVLHRYVIFTPGRLTVWAGCLVFCIVSVLQWKQPWEQLPGILLTLLLAPLCLWGAP